MLTNDQLHTIMPRLPAAKSAELFPFLTAAMTEFSIDAPARMAAFLAQLAHESAQLRFMEEIWGPTPAQQRYEPQTTLATKLGNTDAGDGKRFKGRGPIQITGRANYSRFGDLLSLNLIGDPDRAAAPEVAFRIAALFWAKKGLNELADEGTDDAFREITRRINGGFNGLAERQQFYATARQSLGVAAPKAARGTPRAIPRAPEPDFPRGIEMIREEAALGRPPRRAPAPRPRKRATAKRRRSRAAASPKRKKSAPRPERRAAARRKRPASKKR
jgi:predicted chitinase